MQNAIRVLAVFAILAQVACEAIGEGGARQPAVPRWSLGLEMAIGSLDDPDMGLTRVTQVAFGPDDRLYIAQGSESEIRVYDLDGGLLFRIGRDGEGPGEFRSITAFGFLEDTLFVTDGALRRFSLLEPDGRYINSFTWLSAGDDAPTPPVFHMATGPQVARNDGSGLLRQGVVFAAGTTEQILTPWLRIWRESDRQDTIVIQTSDRLPLESMTEDGREFSFVPPINDYSLFQLMADGSGVAVVERETATTSENQVFRVLVIDPSADTVLTNEYTYTPVPIRPDEVDRQVTLRLERYRMDAPRPSREGMARVYSRDGFLPRYYPPVTSVRTAQDGRIWIEREPTNPDSTTWEAIGPKGDMEGSIRLPSGAQILAGRGNLLAVLMEDEFDVPYVHVYRINR